MKYLRVGANDLPKRKKMIHKLRTMMQRKRQQGYCFFCDNVQPKRKDARFFVQCKLSGAFTSLKNCCTDFRSEVCHG